MSVLSQENPIPEVKTDAAASAVTISYTVIRVPPAPPLWRVVRCSGAGWSLNMRQYYTFYKELINGLDDAPNKILTVKEPNFSKETVCVLWLRYGKIPALCGLAHDFHHIKRSSAGAERSFSLIGNQQEHFKKGMVRNCSKCFNIHTHRGACTNPFIEGSKILELPDSYLTQRSLAWRNLETYYVVSEK